MPPTIYYGQGFEWDAPAGDPTDLAWRGKTKAGRFCNGMIDLRSPAQRAVAGPTKSGFVFTIYDGPVGADPDMALMGQPDDLVSLTRRQQIASDLSLPRTPSAGTATNVIFEVLTSLADPDRGAMCGIIIPTHRRHMELHIPGTRRPRERNNRRVRIRLRPSDPWFDKVRRRRREDYRQIRAASLANGDTVYRRWLWNESVKWYGDQSGWADLVPDDLTSEPGPLPPSTTYTEGWPSGDSDTLSDDLTWTEVSGNHWTLSSNAARQKSNNSNPTARAEHDTSGDDVDMQGTVTWNEANSRRLGPASRFEAAANTHYGGYGNSASDQDEIVHMSAGTNNVLASQAHTIGTDTFLTLHGADGSTLTVTVGPASELSTTDTNLTGQTRHGMTGRMGSTATRWCSLDDWQVADIAAGDPEVGLIGGKLLRGGMLMGGALVR